MANSRKDEFSSQVPILTTIEMSVEDYKHIVEKLSTDLFNIHTSMTCANEEIARLSSKNALLIKKNEELELIVVQVENLEEKIEYLQNKILCASQIEKSLRK